MTQSFSNRVRNVNLTAGREAAEAMIRERVDTLRASAHQLSDVLGTRALFSSSAWNDRRAGFHAYLAAAGAELAAAEGQPRVESSNLLLGAADEAVACGDPETARAIAALALRLGELAGRDDVVSAAPDRLASLSTS